jgi:hypothetical protein
MVLSREVTPNELLEDPTLLLHEKDFDGRTYFRFPQYLVSLLVTCAILNSTVINGWSRWIRNA